jgi:hypothetical protein
MFGQKPRLRPEPVHVYGGGGDNAVVDQDYDYSYTTPTPTTASASGLAQNSAYGRPVAQFNHGETTTPTTTAATVTPNSATTTTEEALLMDLAHLEEVHEEAERMKLLGNKRSKSRNNEQKPTSFFLLVPFRIFYTPLIPAFVVCFHAAHDDYFIYNNNQWPTRSLPPPTMRIHKRCNCHRSDPPVMFF